MKGDLLAVSSAFLWSIAVILMRIAGYKIKVIPLNIFKNTVALLGFAAVIFYEGAPLVPSLSIHQWFLLLLSGLFGIAIADVFFVASLNRLGASLQAVVDCVYAPSIILTAFILFGELITWVEVAGGTLVGVAVIVGSFRPTEVKDRKSLYEGLALAISCHIFMAIGAMIVRDIYRDEGISIAWVCGVRFLFANAVLILWGMKYRRKDLWSAFILKGTWKYTIPSATLGTFLATMFWLGGFKYQIAGRAAIYNQMSSVFTAVLGILILKEVASINKVAGILLGVTGALIISLA